VRIQVAVNASQVWCVGSHDHSCVYRRPEAWNNTGVLKNSLSDVQQFCFQLTAELDMGYESPALPIHMLNGSASFLNDAISTMNNLKTGEGVSPAFDSSIAKADPINSFEHDGSHANSQLRNPHLKTV